MAFIKRVRNKGVDYYYFVRSVKRNKKALHQIILSLGVDYKKAVQKADKYNLEIAVYGNMKQQAKKQLRLLGATSDEIKTVFNADSHKKLLRGK